ncbi:MAG: hypothetical protein CL678_03020 [Bdellovibrionaceae bacterium]|nr:hypothetical protein [Pseudobdellovibrionaceae bacterium]|tara:strand:+ start:1102 stop:1902 length:801 start_codon:yes stop_codon:yes gene_type:complete
METIFVSLLLTEGIFMKISVEDFFNSQSVTWGDQYQSQKAFKSRKTIALHFASRFQDGSKILDFGCGSGEIAEFLSHKNLQVTGCDANQKMLDLAKKRENQNFTCFQSSLPPFPLEPRQFDGIYSLSVFEYLDDPNIFFREFSRILKPGGTFLFTVPDMRDEFRIRETKQAKLARNPVVRVFLKFFQFLEKYLFTFGISLSKFREFPLIGRAFVQYEVFKFLNISKNRFSPSKWKQLGEDCGFDVESIPNSNGPLLTLVFINKVGS